MKSCSRIRKIIHSMVISDTYWHEKNIVGLNKLHWYLLGTGVKEKRYTFNIEMALLLSRSILDRTHFDITHYLRTLSANIDKKRMYPAKLYRKINNFNDHSFDYKVVLKESSDCQEPYTLSSSVILACYFYGECSLSDMNSAIEKSVGVVAGHDDSYFSSWLIAQFINCGIAGKSYENLISSIKSSGILKGDASGKIDYLLSCLEKDCYDQALISKYVGDGRSAIDTVFTAIFYGLKFKNESLQELINALSDIDDQCRVIASLAGAVWGAFCLNDYDVDYALLVDIERYEHIDYMAQSIASKEYVQ